MFSNVAHFTLDLSNNKLETLPADVLYENASTWEHKGTQILKGQLIIKTSNEPHFLLILLPSSYNKAMFQIETML